MIRAHLTKKKPVCSIHRLLAMSGETGFVRIG